MSNSSIATVSNKWNDWHGMPCEKIKSTSNFQALGFWRKDWAFSLKQHPSLLTKFRYDIQVFKQVKEVPSFRNSLRTEQNRSKVSLLDVPTGFLREVCCIRAYLFLKTFSWVINTVFPPTPSDNDAYDQHGSSLERYARVLSLLITTGDEC